MHVLSVGAGTEQIYSIQRAQELGLKVIAVDGDPNAPGFRYADHSLTVDFQQEEKLLKIAHDYNIRSILPSPAGKPLMLIGWMNNELGLRGVSQEAANNCVDKSRLFRLLRENGIACPEQRVVQTFEDIDNMLRDTASACILKPQYGSGSRGVIVISDPYDKDLVIKEHFSKCHHDEISIMEEFVEGREFGIDGVVINEQFHMILCREKLMTALPFRQEIGYMAPANIREAEKEGIRSYLQEVVRVTGLNDCLIQADLILNENGVYLIEISGRPSGLNMSSLMVPYVTGLDVIAEFIKYQLHMECQFQTVMETKPMVMLFLDLPPGKIKNIPPTQKILKNANIISFECQLNDGDIVTEVTCGKDIFPRGFVSATGRDVEEALKEAKAVIDQIQIEPIRGNAYA